MRELARLLPELSPPAGGLQRLQQRIAAPVHTRKLSPSLRFGIGALALCACVLSLALPEFITQQRDSRVLSEILRQALAPPMPEQGIRVVNGAALELPSSQSNVRIYLVQTDTPPDPSPLTGHDVR